MNTTELQTKSLADWEAELVETIHFLHAHGWAPATSSNYSFRYPASAEITISQSGRDKGKFSVEDLMRINAYGEATYPAGARPSAETLLHTAIYDLVPETGCVLHTHSPNGTVVSMVYEEQKAIPFTGFELLKGLAGIRTHTAKIMLPIFPNSQDMADLSKDVRQFLKANPKAHGFLLAGHGLYAWGETIADAKRHIEVFEFLFECMLKLKTYGYH